tara:strand:- start:5488 stop:5985 length:498 start_codon:yes stop_codon:yes gene_type:complete
MLLNLTSFGFVALMLVAAFADATRFTIPNWLSIAVAALFPVAALIAGLGWPEAGLHLLTGFVGLLLGMALFAAGWVGGGDAKLFAGGTLWFGWPIAVAFLIHTVLVGGVLVLALILLRRVLPLAGVSPERLTGTALAPAAPVPYGIAIAGGAIWTLPATVFALPF